MDTQIKAKLDIAIKVNNDLHEKVNSKDEVIANLTECLEKIRETCNQSTSYFIDEYYAKANILKE